MRITGNHFPPTSLLPSSSSLLPPTKGALFPGVLMISLILSISLSLFSCKISGQNFIAGIQVVIGDPLINVEVVSPGLITAVIPSSNRYKNPTNIIDQQESVIISDPKGRSTVGYNKFTIKVGLPLSPPLSPSPPSPSLSLPSLPSPPPSPLPSPSPFPLPFPLPLPPLNQQKLINN